MLGDWGLAPNGNPCSCDLKLAVRFWAKSQKYFNAWIEASGDLFCYFSSVGRWSKWGSWGILQHYDDDPAQSPKFTATFHWAKSQGQKVNLP
jgi:hypothetical protein